MRLSPRDTYRFGSRSPHHSHLVATGQSYPSPGRFERRNRRLRCGDGARVAVPWSYSSPSRSQTSEVLDRAGVSRHTASEAERIETLRTCFGIVLAALDRTLRGHPDQRALTEKFYSEAQHIAEQLDDSD